MTSSTPTPPAPDDTTKIIGTIYIVAQLGWLLISKWPGRLRKKKKRVSTDEYDTVKIILDKDEAVKELQSRLAIREAALIRAEEQIKTLQPLANETESLRAINMSLTTLNENLQHEHDELSKQIDDKDGLINLLKDQILRKKSDTKGLTDISKDQLDSTPDGKPPAQ